jgi:hypothetical protein
MKTDATEPFLWDDNIEAFYWSRSECIYEFMLLTRIRTSSIDRTKIIQSYAGINKREAACLSVLLLVFSGGNFLSIVEERQQQGEAEPKCKIW